MDFFSFLILCIYYLLTTIYLFYSLRKINCWVHCRNLFGDYALNYFVAQEVISCELKIAKYGFKSSQMQGGPLKILCLTQSKAEGRQYVKLSVMCRDLCVSLQLKQKQMEYPQMNWIYRQGTDQTCPCSSSGKWKDFQKAL